MFTSQLQEHYSEGNTLELQVEGQPPIRFQPKAIPEITEAIATVGLTTTMQRSVKFQRSRSAAEAEPFPVITIVVIVAAVVVLVAVILVVIGIVQASPLFHGCLSSQPYEGESYANVLNMEEHNCHLPAFICTDCINVSFCAV